MTQVVICNYPLEQYPPIQNIINILLKNNLDVVYIGLISNSELARSFVLKGVKYYELDLPADHDSSFLKMFRLVKNKFKVALVLNKINITEQDRVWLFGEPTIWSNHKLPSKFKTISYLFEMPSLAVPLKYKLLNPFLDYRKSLENSYLTVACEETRGLITKGIFSLTKMPVIIPNKNILNFKDIRYDSNVEIDSFIENIKDKKIILYQGIFNYPERRLDELCESINYLDEEFVIVLVGGGGRFDELRKTYESKRVLFHGFISYPNYFKITEISYIGFLSYYPCGNNISQVLNVNFCAPNKVFEYGACGLPMISNNVPGLKLIFDKFKCGVAIGELNAERIAQGIKYIDENYQEYSKGSLAYFNSVDVESKILEVL